MTAPRIKTLPFGLVLLTGLSLACASAPTEPPRFWVEPVALGDRVRVWAPSVGVESMVGTVLALRPDTIVIEDGRHVVLAISSVTKLEVSRGTRSRARTGGMVGLIAGAAAGAVICIASECSIISGSAESELLEDERLSSLALATALGGLVGYGLGVLIGSTMKVDIWEEIPLRLLRVSIVPSSGGKPSVGLSVKLHSLTRGAGR